ncbi:hypothetical protein EON79_06380 [bacterium]|nr:MAG: hypothetical protein EON79_06380 [bacterium]
MTSFLAGLVTAGVAAWPLYRFLLAIRSRQTVSAHVQEHAHKQGTPTMGGLMILVGLAGVLGRLAYVGQTALAVGLGIFLALLALVGFIDDFLIPRLMPGKRGLGWIPKLALQFGTSAIGLWALGFTSGPTLALSVLAILFYSNAFNFADGLDWLSGSILIAFVFGVLVLGTGGVQADVAYGLLGAMVPFMVLNRPKAKVFMGDVGSMPLGGLLGLFVLWIVFPGASSVFAAASPKTMMEVGLLPSFPVAALAALVLSFVMIAELVPVPLQIASVKLRKKKIFPFTPSTMPFSGRGGRRSRWSRCSRAFNSSVPSWPGGSTKSDEEDRRLWTRPERPRRRPRRFGKRHGRDRLRRSRRSRQTGTSGGSPHPWIVRRDGMGRTIGRTAGFRRRQPGDPEGSSGAPAAERGGRSAP